MLVGGDPSDPKTAPSLKNAAAAHLRRDQAGRAARVRGRPEVHAHRGHEADVRREHDRPPVRQRRRPAGVRAGLGPLVPRPLERSRARGRSCPATSCRRTFAAIPDDSPKENVKASIPGTEQAEEAVVANSVPQTAQVKRSEAKFAPVYDGEPKLAPIEGTKLQYVVNTSAPIDRARKPGGVLRRPERRLVRLEQSRWSVARRDDGPGGHLLDPGELAAALRDLRQDLRLDARKRSSSATRRVTPVRTSAADASSTAPATTTPPWIGTVWYGPPVHLWLRRQPRLHAVGRLARRLRLRLELGRGHGRRRMGLGCRIRGGAATVGEATTRGRTVPGYGAVWGPRGGYAAWGPGYWGGTTGNMYHRWGSTTAVTRRAGGYNAWTGNRWATQAGRAYNSRTGVAAAGQRGVVGNVYSGNYAAGARGGAVNTRTGSAAVGRAGTVGSAGGSRSRAGRRLSVVRAATPPRSVPSKAIREARSEWATMCTRAVTATSTNTTKEGAGTR